VQYRFFRISIHDPDEGTAELNRFLTAHRILAVDRHFVQDASNSAWAVCVSFDSGEASIAVRPGSMARRGKVDFNNILRRESYCSIQLQHATADAVFKGDRIEVQQEPDFATTEMKIRLKLGLVQGQDVFYGLDFKQNLIADYDVCAVAAFQGHTVVFQRQSHLPSEGQVVAV
jgi:hypothetical protein